MSSRDWRWKFGEAIDRLRARYQFIGRKTAPFLAIVYQQEQLKAVIVPIFKSLKSSFMDLLPIIVMIAVFQTLVLQQPIPQLGRILWGALLVLAGLSLFIKGLQMALFPIGEEMAYSFVRKGNPWWLLAFAFLLGFGTTAAEPTLIAIAEEASEVAAAGGVIPDLEEVRENYELGLRLTVALSVGFSLVIGVLRILKGWPIQHLIIGAYIGVTIMTMFAPREIIGIAYDSGGVTTSTVTVPLVTALGVGLARSIRGRETLVDGFGLIAFASLAPMVFVMGYGMLF